MNRFHYFCYCLLYAFNFVLYNTSSQWCLAYCLKKFEPILRFFCSLQLCTYVRITFVNITIKVILSLCACNLTKVNCIGFWKNIRTAQGQIIFDGEMLIATKMVIQYHSKSIINIISFLVCIIKALV